MAVQIGDTSKHTRGCDALTPGEACTCSLEYRRAWETERTMRQAWRKRAVDAEALNASGSQIVAAIEAERARCVEIVNAARFGEVDQDFRTIRNIIKDGFPYPFDEEVP